MRIFTLGVLAGTLGLVGGCVDDNPPVSRNTQLQNLSGNQIWEVCNWARDYSGGETTSFSCPDDDLTDDDFGDAVYIPPSMEQCQQTLVMFQDSGCSFTVGDYQELIDASAENPCDPQTVTDSQGCSLTRTYNQSSGT